MARFEEESVSVVLGTPAAASAGMEFSEELLKKIRELEVGQAQLKQEMSKLIPGVGERRRSQPVSPRRGVPVPPPPPPSKGTPPGRPPSGGFEGGPRAWARGSASFPHSSPLQKEGRATGSGDASTSARLPERQYSRVLQSLGQSVHILDLDGRIIYWLDFWFFTVS